jgi:tetratricopeptide (TPR) repeat protein
MTQTQDPKGRPGATPLADLFTGYLARQAEAHAAGLGFPEGGDVLPYEAVPVQPVDPQLAWHDALGAARHGGAPGAAWAVPPEWPALVAALEPAAAPAFALGNFPQLVRDLQPLLAAGGELPAPPASARPVPVAGLTEWAAQARDYPHVLLAAGVLRLARQFDAAADLLARHADAPVAWQAVRANEEAALLWHRGRHAEALAAWEAQAESVPVLFNRGLALLFLGRPGEARGPLRRAAERLPDTSAWHHLTELYRTLADARGA